MPVLAVVHVAWARAADVQPRSAGEWGALLLVAGFALLPLGVRLHRKLSRILDVAASAAPDSATTGIAPSTSATVPLS